MEVISSRVISSNSMPSCHYNSGARDGTQLGNSVSGVCFRRGGNRFPTLRRNSDSGFLEKGHLDYYRVSPVFCGEKKEKGKGKSIKGWKEVSTKKRMKLLKGLAKDLSEFSELGFGLGLDCGEGLVGGDDKSKTISEAAEILLAQLKLLRAEEDKSMKEKEDCESSSSSESSDSDCEEVVDMKCFRKASIVQTIETPEGSPLILPTPERSTSIECCNMILETTLNDNSTIEALNSEAPNLNQSTSLTAVTTSSMTMAPPKEKTIEVCMGGKCKKLGSPALMAEFQRVVGDETAVVGCKCMGKCKSAPNVRVMNGDNDFLRAPSNPVLTGVGLEDVELIVANYLVEEKGFAAAAAAAAVPF